MKGQVKESSTVYAQGGIAVALEQGDTPNFHFEDTLAAGDGLCSQDAVRILVEQGPERVSELIQLGADFDRHGDDFHYTKEAAHSRRRILHAGDATGREIEKALGNYLRQHPKVVFYPHTSVVELLTDDYGCYGVVASDHDGPVAMLGKAVILATGGLGQLFEFNTNPPVASGDGIALALAAGAEVQDLEFIQFHPTTLYTGDKKPISIFLISEAVRGEGAVLRNIHGERFMTRYDARAELAPRDVVSRAIHAEMQLTHTPHVYLDLSAVEGDIATRFPTIFARCLESNIDIRQDFIPVTPGAHYSMGGVRTDLNGQTSVQGLYAVGEVAGLGIHGANRLASNSLLDGLVFGHIAGQHAGKITSKLRQGPIQFNVPESRGLSAAQRAMVKSARNRIRAIMWQHVGIIRTEAGLKAAIEALEKIQSDVADSIFESSWMEVQHMSRVSKLVAQFALTRTESRGAHFRADFPEKNDLEWGRHLVYRSTLPTPYLAD